MKPRFSPLFSTLLALAISGCLANTSPAPSGGAEEIVRSDPATPPPDAAVAGPVAEAGPNVLGPRVDSERVGEGLIAYTAFYGPGFSQPVPVGGVSLLLFGGRLELPLLVKKLVTDLADGTVAANPEPGLQIRLIHEYSDAAGVRRFRSCDTMTGPVRPDGRNAAFTGLNLGEGGQAHLFLVLPGPSVVIPTADFSAACADLSDASRQTYVMGDTVVSGGRYEHLGTFPLMLMLDLGPSRTGVESPEILTPPGLVPYVNPTVTPDFSL
ncbi:MAG TPA: hypothetical protein VLJ37_00825 [bacterium]|nr:hypothetical protein [bacterium]